MTDLKKRFRLITRSMIQCLDKCQIAVMTVVTLLTTIFEFDVRKAVSESYHKDISECRNNLELFGYLNLYWNYLSFKPLSLLLNKLVLKKYGGVFASFRKELYAYNRDVQNFEENTMLVAFLQAVPYIEHAPPPGFQKMVTEHDWSETFTLREVKKFQRSFLDTFSLPEHTMMFDGIKRGSFKVTWFTRLSATTVTILKGSNGKIEVFRDFNVVSFDIDTSGSMSTTVSEEPESALEMETGTTAMEECKNYSNLCQYYVYVISDKRDHSESHITEEIIFFSYRIWHNINALEEPLKKHGVLDEASLTLMEDLSRGRWSFMDVMHYVMYRLGKKENGLQIFYHCLREIQYVHSSFRRIVEGLETEGLLIKEQHTHIVNHRSTVVANIYSYIFLITAAQRRGSYSIPIPGPATEDSPYLVC